MVFSFVSRVPLHQLALDEKEISALATMLSIGQWQCHWIDSQLTFNS